MRINQFKFFYSNLPRHAFMEPALCSGASSYWNRFVKCNATEYIDILHNRLLQTLWQQLGEEPNVGVMVGLGVHILLTTVYLCTVLYCVLPLSEIYLIQKQTQHICVKCDIYMCKSQLLF